MSDIIKLIDPETLGVLQGKLYFPERPRQLGKVKYIHFAGNKEGINQRGLYLPSEDDWLLEELLNGKIVLEQHEAVRKAYKAISYVEQLAFYAPGTHYSCAWITGDVGEIRKININQETKEVLVIPQGRLRADANSANFAACKMKHPLSDPQRMLEVMALTMYRSGMGTPYFRGIGVADTGNDMALQHPGFSTTFLGTTWKFFDQPSYALPQAPKRAMVSPLGLEGADIARNKVVSIYQRRINDRQTMLQTERAHHFGANDTAYFIPNGMLSDFSCQNVAFVVDFDDYIKIIFVEGSQGNYFFEGKTQKTVYNVIQKLQREGISVVKAQTPAEFAREAGYGGPFSEGRGLTYSVLKNNIDGMIAMGTFKGIEYCEGLLPEEGEPVLFSWKTKKAVQMVQELLWKSVYGINSGTTLTQDQQYCCMFDVADLQKGIAKPLDLRGATLEDVL